MHRRNALKFLSGLLTVEAGAACASTGRASTAPRQTRTMLDMTFPEFEVAARDAQIGLLPVGAIEEHGPHLPLNSDALGAVDILGDVQRHLSASGVRSLIGPSLNIGITDESDGRRRDGTYMYPGSLTIRRATFVALYVDLLRSLKENGLQRIFLYSHHLGSAQLSAVADAAVRATAEVPGLSAHALIDSERLARLDLKPSAQIVPIVEGLNFKMLAKLFGGTNAFTTHADGWETSLMLHYRPEAVRKGYRRLPQVSSAQFLRATETGERASNPSGIGGFPTSTATAEAGRRIADYRSGRVAEAILKATKAG